MADEPRRAPRRAGGRCPVCRKPTDPAVRPFCSVRCRQVDLARWLSGEHYVVPGEPEAPEEEPR